jgi:transposase
VADRGQAIAVAQGIALDIPENMQDRLGKAIRSRSSTKGRDFGAWLGLVPKQISIGDRTILGKISRRGNRYLRALFVQAAWVVVVRVKCWERT